MADLLDPGGISDSDTLTAEQTGDAGSIPPPPDFARDIPVAILEQGKRDDEANAWAAQQRAQLGDLWASMAHDDLNQRVQQAATEMDSIPSEPVLSVTALSPSGDPTAGGPAEPIEAPTPPPQDQSQQPLTMGTLADSLPAGHRAGREHGRAGGRDQAARECGPGGDRCRPGRSAADEVIGRADRVEPV